MWFTTTLTDIFTFDKREIRQWNNTKYHNWTRRNKPTFILKINYENNKI